MRITHLNSWMCSGRHTGCEKGVRTCRKISCESLGLKFTTQVPPYLSNGDEEVPGMSVDWGEGFQKDVAVGCLRRDM